MELGRLRRALGRGRVILPLGAAYLASQAAILRIIEPLGRDHVLRLQTALTPEAFLTVKQGWVDAGVLDAYWRHFLLDFPHPLLYGAFLAACLAGALRRSRAPASLDGLLLLPFVAAACDLVENSLHVLFLLRPAATVQPWVAMSGIFTHAKWLLVLVSMLAALALSLGAVRSARVKGRPHRTMRSPDS